MRTGREEEGYQYAIHIKRILSMGRKHHVEGSDIYGYKPNTIHHHLSAIYRDGASVV